MTIAEILASLSVAHLVAYYNAVADNPVKNFKSKAEALARIERLPEPRDALELLTGITGVDYSDADAAAEAVANAEQTTETETTAEEKPKKKGRAKKEKVAKEPKPRGRGIGAFCKEKIMEGLSNKEIVDLVQANWPDAKTSTATVAWYRSNLKGQGITPPAPKIEFKCDKTETEAETKTEAQGDVPPADF